MAEEAQEKWSEDEGEEQDVPNTDEQDPECSEASAGVDEGDAQSE